MSREDKTQGIIYRVSDSLDPKLAPKFTLLTRKANNTAPSPIQLLDQCINPRLILNLSLLAQLLLLLVNLLSPRLHSLPLSIFTRLLVPLINSIHCVLQILMLLETLPKVELLLRRPNLVLETAKSKVVGHVLEEWILCIDSLHDDSQVPVGDDLAGDRRADVARDVRDVRGHIEGDTGLVKLNVVLERLAAGHATDFSATDGLLGGGPLEDVIQSF